MFNELYKEIKEHALADYPNESCGLILDDKYIPCINSSDDKQNSFSINSSLMSSRWDDIQAIIHSHPNGNIYPSKQDMISQIRMNKTWGLVACKDNAVSKVIYWGDEARNPNLEGRGFIHGVQDCYSIIRDWYFYNRGVNLKNFARSWQWWENNENMYIDNFNEAGFKSIDEKEVEVGDVFFMMIKSNVENHGGVYIGDNMIIHHLSSSLGYDESRLSKKSIIGTWNKKITKWLRYAG